MVVGRRDGVGLRLLLGAASLCVTVAVGESALAFVGFEVRSGMGRCAESGTLLGGRS